MRLIWVIIPLVLIGVIGIVILAETTKTSGPEITFFTNKEIYKIGEPVSITMENTGNDILSGPSSPCGFTIFDENGNAIKSFWGMYLAECPFEPGEKISVTWISKSYSGVPVRPGIYTLSAQYWDSNYEQRLIFEKQIEIIDPNDAFGFFDSLSSSEYITMLRDSEMVFSGKLISKKQLTSPDSKNLEFKIIENFKSAKENTVTVYTHEGSWEKCAGLEEDLEYLIFVSPKYDVMTCYYAISLPTDVTDELRELSSNIPWW